MKYLVLTYLHFLLFGCTSSSTKLNELSVSPHKTLIQNIVETKNSIVKDPCDDLWFERKLEIASALLKYEEDINTYLAKLKSNEILEKNNDKMFNEKPFGPIFIRQSYKESLIENKWREYSTDWTNVYLFYLKIKDQPINENWFKLSRSARSLIMNDHRRLIRYFSFGLTENSKPTLNRILSLIEQCLDNSSCSLPDFTLNELNILNSIPIYSYFYKKILSAQDKQNRRDYYFKIKKWIIFDLESRYGFSKNTAVMREAESIIIPMRAGDFEEVKDELAAIIEKYWSTDKIQLKILWLNQEDSRSGVYRFIADKTTGNRDLTSRKDLTMTIASGATESAIAHEFGHVLGFADFYYEVFDPVNCGYKTRLNSSDLMSDIENGKVTKDEFLTLVKEYLNRF